MGQMQIMKRTGPVPLAKKGNTTVIKETGGWFVKLYATVVIRRTGNVVTIDTGGYNTVTTRARINQACNEYNLPFTVGTHKGDIYLWFRDERAQAHYMLQNGAVPDRVGRFYFDTEIVISLPGDES
jgi:hypothetical protein